MNMTSLGGSARAVSIESLADSAGGLGETPAGLQRCLGSMLTAFERSVGFAEGVVMSFDPDVLLPNAFAPRRAVWRVDGAPYPLLRGL